VALGYSLKNQKKNNQKQKFEKQKAAIRKVQQKLKQK